MARNTAALGRGRPFNGSVVKRLDRPDLLRSREFLVMGRFLGRHRVSPFAVAI